MGKRLDDNMGLVEDIVSMAEEHGQESDAVMEVVDLQESLRQAWTFLTAEQRQTVYKNIREQVFQIDDEEDR